MNEYMLVGSIPLLTREIELLARQEQVTLMVNLCKEWDTILPHSAKLRSLYERLGIAHLELPTIDFDAPAAGHLIKGVDAIRKHVEAGHSVYVHCKAGRGRSVAQCLAYLIVHENMNPQEADAVIRSVRPHISKKWKLPVVQAFVEYRETGRFPGTGSSPGLPRGSSSSKVAPAPLPTSTDPECPPTPSSASISIAGSSLSLVDVTGKVGLGTAAAATGGASPTASIVTVDAQAVLSAGDARSTDSPVASEHDLLVRPVAIAKTSRADSESRRRSRQ